jgi:hypothetical protein
MGRKDVPMNAPSSPIARMAAYAVVLAVAFGGGALIGSTVGPDPSPEPAPAQAPVEHPGPDHTGTP